MVVRPLEMFEPTGLTSTEGLSVDRFILTDWLHSGTLVSGNEPTSSLGECPLSDVGSFKET